MGNVALSSAVLKVMTVLDLDRAMTSQKVVSLCSAGPFYIDFLFICVCIQKTVRSQLELHKLYFKSWP